MKKHGVVTLIMVLLLSTALCGSAYAADTSWDSLYKTFIAANLVKSDNGDLYTTRSGQGEFYRVMIADLNMDKVPDLLLAPSNAAAEFGAAYTIQGGKVVPYDTEIDGLMTLNLYKKKTKYVFLTSGAYGDLGSTVGEYQGTNWTMRFNKVKFGKKTHYYVNNKKVSSSTYNAKYKAYFAKLKKVATHKGTKLYPDPLAAFQKECIAYNHLIQQGKVPK